VSGIFISYRREDSAGYAGRLYDRLRQHFGEDHIFLDVQTEPGRDFEVEIDKAISSCDSVLVVVGRRWLEITAAKGLRPDGPKDYVRMEVAAAVRTAVVEPIRHGCDGVGNLGRQIAVHTDHAADAAHAAGYSK